MCAENASYPLLVHPILNEIKHEADSHRTPFTGNEIVGQCHPLKKLFSTWRVQSSFLTLTVFPSSLGKRT